MAEKENIHKGHRQRMMKKFLEHGIDCFEDHEVLEILLYSAYTRRNTNDIAHELIKRFGSLKGVLSAEFNDLCEVDNVGPNAAAMLRFFKAFAMRHSHEDYSGIVLNKSEEVCRFCHDLIGKATVEVVHALFLDDAFALISEAQISRGVTHTVDLELKTIVKKAIEHKCNNIIIMHNHPDGLLAPSRADVTTTRRTAVALSNIGLNLVDHIIVNQDDAVSMRTARVLPDVWDC